MVVVIGREQHQDAFVLHLGDDLLHVARRRGNPRFGLDVIEAGDVELTREIVPLLVVARHLLAAERHTLLEPAAQPVRQRLALIRLALEEVEQLPLAVEVGERGSAQELHQVVAEQRGVDAVLEILLALREVRGVVGRHPLQPGENIARDLHRVERIRRQIEQGNAGVGRDVAGPAFGDLGVAGLVEQRRDPQLQVESGRDEHVCLGEQRHEARLGLHVVRILVAHGDGVHDALVAHDFAGDGAVRGERRDDLHRRGRRRGAHAAQGQDQRNECAHISRSRVCVVRSPRPPGRRAGGWCPRPDSFRSDTAPGGRPIRSPTR